MKVPVNCAYDKMITIKDIKPHPRNPNRHPEKQIAMLAELIKNHGWRSPITVSNLSGFVIRGHGRLMAARRLGLKTVPVDYQDYTDELLEIADLVADNRIQDYSELDMEEVNQILIEFQNVDFSVELAGFNLDEFFSKDESKKGKENKSSDKDNSEYEFKYSIQIFCDSEEHQRSLLEKFESESLECRALML